MRVAVIGCGVVGSCVGWYLRRSGADVVMIDAAQPGAGVTNWTFSWVNASNKTQTRAYFDLNVAGMAAHRELADSLGGGEWWHPTGHLRWSDTATGSETLRGDVDHLRSWGYDVSLWEADKVHRILEPGILFPGGVGEVAFYGDEGWIDGRGLVARLVDDAVGAGAEAHFGRPVTDIVLSHDRVTEVVLAGGLRHGVDAVVNAAGPAGRDVAELVGRTLPMRDEPGLVARLACDAVPVHRALHAPHVELRPDGDGRVVVHSRDIDALIDPAADPVDLSERLRRLAVDVVPALDGSVVIEARVSWRPIPLDGFPSVGGLDGLVGYYEAVTHSGITLGVIIGRLLGREIIDGSVDDLLRPYRPDRFVAAVPAPS